MDSLCIVCLHTKELSQEEIENEGNANACRSKILNDFAA